MHHHYRPPAIAQALTSSAYTNAAKAFGLAREPLRYSFLDTPRLDYLPPERVEAPLYALLTELGLRPPGANTPPAYAPGGRLLMVLPGLYGELEMAVMRASDMEPDAARHRVDAALSALHLAAFPADLYSIAADFGCPYARLMEAGWWMQCDLDEHPEPGWHQSMAFLSGGRFAQADDRCVNLTEWTP